MVKTGRTQLHGAVPMRLGQSFNAFVSMVDCDIKRLNDAKKERLIVNIGPTAIGTSITVGPEYFHIPNLKK